MGLTVAVARANKERQTKATHLQETEHREDALPRSRGASLPRELEQNARQRHNPDWLRAVVGVFFPSKSLQADCYLLVTVTLGLVYVPA